MSGFGNNKKNNKKPNKEKATNSPTANSTPSPTTYPTIDTITQTFSTLMQALAENCQGTLGLGIQKIAGEISVGAFLQQCINNIPHGLESLPTDLQETFNSALNNTDISNSTINLEELSNLTDSFNRRGLSNVGMDANDYKYIVLGAIALLATAAPLILAKLRNEEPKKPLTPAYETKVNKPSPVSSVIPEANSSKKPHGPG